jgi:hypothetical protein
MHPTSPSHLKTYSVVPAERSHTTIPSSFGHSSKCSNFGRSEPRASLTFQFQLSSNLCCLYLSSKFRHASDSIPLFSSSFSRLLSESQYMPAPSATEGKPQGHAFDHSNPDSYTFTCLIPSPLFQSRGLHSPCQICHPRVLSIRT